MSYSEMLIKLIGTIGGYLQCEAPTTNTSQENGHGIFAIEC